MRDLVRQELAYSSTTWVVKVGTSVLADPAGGLDEARVAGLADQIAAVIARGRRVALVSSGAVGAGIGRLGLAKRPTDLRLLQAAAAAGQATLMRAYDDAFRRHGLSAGQLLLTRDDFDDRSRYLNVRNTLLTLFEHGAVPIINENDTVSVDEIRFGDNDQLAALVANALLAPLMVVLSVVDGLLPDREAEVPIPLIADLDEAITRHVRDDRSALGSGGMRSKLEAARIVARSGGSVIIASGRRPDALTAILEGRPIGTLIPAEGRTEQARRRWIGRTARARGAFVADDGARRAVVVGGGSLLPIGVVDIDGDFAKGDVVAVRDRGGREFARGLTNYGTVDARAIRGLRSDQVAEVLGFAGYAELIHRDNLVLTGRERA